ncbi:MAG TPA: hypothetical protein VGC09_18710 [Rhodopila sp.]
MPQFETRLGRYHQTAIGGETVRAYVPQPLPPDPPPDLGALQQRLGIARETTGRQRGRVFVYGALLDLLSEGTDPLPRQP